MDYKKLADLLFPDIPTREEIEARYPKRNLNNGEMVTRFAPSPTGFVHMGSLLTAYINSLMSTQTNGIFMLRIEDTDQKREVENGTLGIIRDLKDYEITIDEGAFIGGEYGSYIQSERKEIYLAFVKDLIKKGLAYPCFCTASELDEIRELQEINKERIGYFGSYSKCKNLSYEEIEQKINEGIPFVIRLNAPGDFKVQHKYHDLIKGEVNYFENDIDIVIMKSDNFLPTYHFAHAVDDYLMGTTHVIRGDEWLSSLPVHLQLFEILGVDAPKYAHIAPVMKNDNGVVRKLSKRKDPEASVSYYQELGIPVDVVKLYLKTLINTNFEEWYISETTEPFTFTFEKMPTSGSLFDVEKLMSISKEYFSRLSALEVYNGLVEYTKKYDEEFYNIITKYKDYTINVLNIERETEKPRKDIASYSDIKKLFYYMFDEYFFNDNTYDGVGKDYLTDGLKEYFDECYMDDELEENWFPKLKEFATGYGYTSDRKEYKANPENFNGMTAKFCEVIRVMLTKSNMSPNLYDILKLLGKERIEKRLNLFISYLQDK